MSARWLRIVSIFIFPALLISCQSDQNGLLSPLPTREITDDLGRKILIPPKIERAISLAPNLTENIFAVGAGDRLVGVTTFCNYPQAAQSIAKAGDTQTPSLETIIALKPQIVLVSTASQLQGFTAQMERQQIAVFVSNPQNLESVYQTLRQFGEIFGQEAQAAETIELLKRRTAEVEAERGARQQVRTFVQISREPLYTVGKTSFITDLIARAGGISLTADIDEAYPKLGKEKAIALDPEAIVLSDSEDNLTPNDVFKDSKAVRERRVLKISADVISRASPRSVDALEAIADFYRQGEQPATVAKPQP